MKTIWLFFWWMSNEAEVSINSAKNIAKYFDKKKYALVLIYWDKDGSFYKVHNIADYKKFSKKNHIHPSDFSKIFDIAFPVTHGKFGEDGHLQSIFAVNRIPYCWCRVLSSALCMDKALFKLFLAWHQIPQVHFIHLDFHLMSAADIQEKITFVKTHMKLPLYIKPANSWSSVGIEKVTSYADIENAVNKAKKHDNKIVIEEWLVHPREIEVAVLWNEKLLVSDPGELLLAKDFYDYEDKYKKNEATVRIPAKLSAEEKCQILSLAKKVYHLCDCSGFARIDFFLHGKIIYVNEVNTLPGFTDISMFPMLMQHMGLSYPALINKIIALAQPF